MRGYLNLSAMPERIQRWVLPATALLWLVVVWHIWSPEHYWPDADGYLLHVAEGRWVAHPPGYALFLVIGRCFHALGLSPYLAVQFASLSLTASGLGVLYLLVRQLLDPLLAQAIAAAAAFSWIVLLNVQTGTSHASDLFTVSLLLLAALRLPSTAHKSWVRDLSFAAALFICAGFRLTTLLLMLPLCLLVALHNYRRPSFWISCLAGIIAIGLWQFWVISESGGYAAYSAAAAAMN
ncbi:MAG: protein O-mannosyl-transferase family, partial [Chthoniobacterales bacterium]